MEDRRARLASLAAKAGRKLPVADDGDENDHGVKTADEQPPYIKFRNYTPQSRELEQRSATVEHEEDGGDNDDKQAMKKRRTDGALVRNGEQDPDVDDEDEDNTLSLEKALQQAKREISFQASVSGSGGRKVEDISSLAPKKVNWDLKRDLQPKLERLERRTQRAIVELLHERLQRESAAGEIDDDDDGDLD